MTIQGISPAGAFPQNGGESGAAQPAAKQAGENNANVTRDTHGAQDTIAEADGSRAASAARADKYDHESAERAASTGERGKGVYKANISHSRVEEDSAGPDDFREVEVLKRKRQSLLQQLAGETDEVIRSQLQAKIQNVSAQISMKDSLAAVK